MAFQITRFPFRNKTIKLSSYENLREGHTFTIITGKNGVGKTQLLTSIVTEYLKNEHNIQIDSDFHTPNKIIAVSNIKYDNFPVRKKMSMNYHYIGNKNSPNSFYTNDRYQVFKHLICNLNSNNKNICEAFNYLGFDPEIKIKLRTISTSNNNIQIPEYANLYEKYSEFFSKDFYAENLNIFFKKVLDLKFTKYLENNNRSLFELENNYFETNYTKTSKYNNEIKSNFKKFLSKQDILFLDLLYRIDVSEKSIKKDTYINLSEIVYSNKIDLIFKNFVYDFNEHYYYPPDNDLLFLLNYNLIKISSVYLRRNSWDNHGISFTDLSSGQQSLFNIFLGISGVIEDNSLICIDEPEVNLHPEWQTEFILKLQNIFNHISGCHFIIATHSPQVVAGLKSKNGYILDLETNVLHSSIDYSKKSADYQLAKLFSAPGYNNEYIIKICLFLLSKIKEQTNFNENDLSNISELKNFQKLLKIDDPVYHLVKEVISLSEV
jgi:predicted ATPase